MTTLHRSYFTVYQSVTCLPNSTFYWLMRGFHRTCVTGVACWQGTLTPPDTWSRPIGTLYVLLVETNPFLELVVIFRTMHFEYPSVLSRCCFFFNKSLVMAPQKQDLGNIKCIKVVQYLNLFTIDNCRLFLIVSIMIKIHSNWFTPCCTISWYTWIQIYFILYSAK